MPSNSLPLPFFFGPDTARMFGLYQEPSGPRRNSAVLICTSRGWELTAIHRTLRALASQFSRRGYAILRFDFPGSGDSPGDDELTTEANCIAAVRLARAELASRSGCSSIGCIGYGAGAAAAAAASGRGTSIFSDIVLWDPQFDSDTMMNALESIDTDHAVLADSRGKVADLLERLGTTHPLRRLEVLRNDRDSWSLEQAYESVAVPGAMMNAIVQWSVKRW